MAAFVGDDAVRRALEVGSDGDLIAHGAGHDEEGGFFSGEAGDEGFEVVGCWIFLEDVVGEGGGGYRFEHAACWGGDCVALGRVNA